MPVVTMTVNGKSVSGEVEGRTLLVNFIRDQLNLTGTHVGCDTSQCGACVVHIDGKAQRSCVTSLSSLEGKSVVTIEGLADSDTQLHPVQQAWLDEDVPQCGYCQPGMIMATVDFLQKNPKPSDEDINKNIDNLCRCGTYVRVRKAIHRAAELSAKVK